MSRLDDLPPDQRAVLLLLVRQGKSHSEIAQMLGISERAVRDRAHAALDALDADSPLAPAAAGSGSAARSLGATSESATRPLGATSESATRSPTGPRVRPDPRPARPAGSRQARPVGSRRAGALLLLALVAAIVVAVVLIANGGGSNRSASGSTATSTTSKAGEPHVDKQLRLTSPDPASKALGVVEVLSQGSQRAFFVVAQNLPATSGFFYAAWLYSSPSHAQVLGRAPAVTANGRLQAVGPLPASAGSYSQMLITRETSERPTHPGPIVLSGPFSLH
jgi:hypothetical protein